MALRRSIHAALRLRGFAAGAQSRLSSTKFPLASRRTVIRWTVATTTGLLIVPSIIYLDSSTPDALPDTTQQPSIGSLVRSYAVFTMCSIPPLVNHAPELLSTFLSIPGINYLTSIVVKHSFFAQFVGGETVKDTIPLLQQLKAEGKGVLLAYSVEVDEHDTTSTFQAYEQAARQRIQEMARSVEAAGDFEDEQVAKGLPRGKTMVAVKLTALLPAESLARFSTVLCQKRPKKRLAIPYPHTPDASDMDVLDEKNPPAPLTAQDVRSLKTLYEELRQICIRAQIRGIPLVVDAEHTWFNPGIDAITLALTREFNRVTSPDAKPLIFGTYQSYLRRGLSHLQASIDDAKRGGYTLGIKLVRGAYRTQEIAVHSKRAPTDRSLNPPPVWLEKGETDDTYNNSVALITSSLKSDRFRNGTPCVSALFGTHNAQSCDIVLNGLVDQGLATREKVEKGSHVILPKLVADRVCFGQLLGMRDELTQYLADTVISPTSIAIKYIPYGALQEVMPYLARRALENQSVLGGEGGAAHERRVAGSEIRKRIFSLF